jgi:hypothetical protein
MRKLIPFVFLALLVLPFCATWDALETNADTRRQISRLTISEALQVPTTTDCTGLTAAEGDLCYDTDDDEFKVYGDSDGDGTNDWAAVGAGGATAVDSNSDGTNEVYVSGSVIYFDHDDDGTAENQIDTNGFTGDLVGRADYAACLDGNGDSTCDASSDITVERSICPDPDEDGTCNIYYITQYGAVSGDGTSDTSAFNSAISAANSAGGGIVYVPNGDFIGKNIEMETNVRVIGDGINSKVDLSGDATTTDAIFIDSVNDSYWSIERLLLDGNAAAASQSGVRVTDDSKHFRVHEVNFTDFPNAGIFIDYDTAQAEFVKIDGNRFYSMQAGSEAVIVEAAINIELSRNECDGEIGFYFNPASSTLEGALVIGNTFKNSTLDGDGVEILGQGDAVNGLTIANNSFHTLNRAIRVRNARGVSIIGNQIYNIDFGGIFVQQVDGLSIIGNQIEDTQNDKTDNNGWVSGDPRGAITIVTFTGNPQQGITITGNRIHDCNNPGIILDGGGADPEGIVIANNTFYDVDGPCIMSQDAEYISIIGNVGREPSSDSQTSLFAPYTLTEHIYLVGNILIDGTNSWDAFIYFASADIRGLHMSSNVFEGIPYFGGFYDHRGKVEVFGNKGGTYTARDYESGSQAYTEISGGVDFDFDGSIDFGHDGTSNYIDLDSSGTKNISGDGSDFYLDVDGDSTLEFRFDTTNFFQFNPDDDSANEIALREDSINLDGDGDGVAEIQFGTTSGILIGTCGATECLVYDIDADGTIESTDCCFVDGGQDADCDGTAD